MKNDPDEIHFDCPKCKRPMSGDKALLGELINCPDCNEPFIPTPRKPAPTPEPKPAAVPKVKDEAESIFERVEQKKRRNKIRARADFFEKLAAVLLVLGVCALVGSILSAVNGNTPATSWIIMAVLFSTAFWLYLTAQLVHIRANTEK